LPDDEDVVPVLLRTDAHCNLGIQNLDVAIATAYDVKIYATLGDEFSSGRYLHAPYDEEKICVAPFYKSLKSFGVDLVGVAGNHETPEAVAFMRELGMTMLEGQTVDVDGVYFFGYGDPVRSNGTGSVPHDSEEQHALNRDLGDLVGKAACLDRQRRDIVMTHEYQMALAITEQFDRCGQPAAMVAAGHTHVGHGPYELPGGQIFMIYDSAGGAEKSPKLDWLNRPAVASVPFVNRRTGELVRLDTVTASPDGSVDISTVLPSQATVPDPAVIPELMPRPGTLDTSPLR
jgi:predicted phosphodiesterase